MRIKSKMALFAPKNKKSDQIKYMVWGRVNYLIISNQLMKHIVVKLGIEQTANAFPITGAKKINKKNGIQVRERGQNFILAGHIS